MIKNRIKNWMKCYKIKHKKNAYCGMAYFNANYHAFSIVEPQMMTIFAGPYGEYSSLYDMEIKFK